LINVSGFHVDPGYKGNLVFSVYNAGSSQISLSAGEPCFLIWFADLILEHGESSEYEKENHEHYKQDIIPTKYIDYLAAGEIASPNALSKRMDDNQKELDKRISLIEKEQTSKDYLVKAAGVWE
jgi:dCTP deaminase